MKIKNRRVAVIGFLCFVSALFLSGCEGLGQKLYEWASRTSHSIEAKVGSTQFRPMRSREELEQDMRANNGQPCVKIVNCSVSQSEVSGGDQVIVTAVYQAYGNSDALPKGKMQIFRNGESKMIVEKPLDKMKPGEMQIMQPLKFPNAAKSGTYSIVIVLEYGGSEAREEVLLKVN